MRDVAGLPRRDAVRLPGRHRRTIAEAKSIERVLEKARSRIGARPHHQPHTHGFLRRRRDPARRDEITFHPCESERAALLRHLANAPNGERLRRGIVADRAGLAHRAEVRGGPACGKIRHGGASRVGGRDGEERQQ